MGASLCLLAWALLAPAPSLGAQVRRWELLRTAPAAHVPGPRLWARSDGLSRQVLGWLHVHGVMLTRVRANLELCDTTPEAHMSRKLGYGLVGLLLPAATVAALGLAGVTPPITVPLVGGMLLGGLLFWVPDAPVAEQAESRRREMRRALSCYLDLVAMSLAGGRGIPEAVPSAARIGTGWAFELLQDTIEHARYTGTTPWQAFVDLGQRIGMAELHDLGNTLLLVADDGAKVRASLTARASTQRRRQLAEAEGEAAKADQSIQMAQVVLAAGFFVFLGYPAVVAVLGV